MSQFVNAIASRLYGKIPDEELKLVMQEVTITASHYDIREREESMVPYTGWIPQAYKDYMVSKSIGGLADSSLSQYKLVLEKMFETLQMPIRDITKNILKAYLYQLKEEINPRTGKKISARTLNQKRIIMVGFFRWAAAEEYIDKDPTATIGPIKYEKKRKKPLSGKELERCRMSCVTLREQALLEFLYATGARVTEVERLNISDVNFDTDEVSLFGKGNKHRTSYLNVKSSILLKEYLASRDDACEALFVYDKKPKARLKKAGIEATIRKIGNRAGVPQVHPHLIRHTTATDMLQRGADVTQVKELLGHENINTTMIYVEADTADVKRSHQRYVI